MTSSSRVTVPFRIRNFITLVIMTKKSVYNVYTYTYGNQHEIYLRVISSNEGLLHSDPQCDGNEELLVRFLELIRRGREQLNT